MTVPAWIVGGLLCAFTARRGLFWFAALLPHRVDRSGRSRSVTVLVAARNEAQALPGLLAACDRLDYPAERLRFVIVDDGSTDATATIIGDWVRHRPRAQAIVLPHHAGKAAALQTALAAAAPSELIAILDADTIPQPAALAALAGAFADERVGAACGFPDPGHDHQSIVARYAALERWVSHLVTFAGKDRLGLQPPVIGAICCLRREAVVAAGGFPQATLAEDIELSLQLSHLGWKTRCLREAVARENVPADLAGFRRQRLRWSRGLMASGRRARGLEELMAALGYLDRLVGVAGALLVMFTPFPLWPLIAYAAAPPVMIVTALWKANPPGKLGYMLAIAPMAFIDIAITLESAAAQLLKKPLRWGVRTSPA